MKRLIGLISGVSLACVAAAMPIAVQTGAISTQPELIPTERWDGEPMLFRVPDGQPVMGPRGPHDLMGGGWGFVDPPRVLTEEESALRQIREVPEGGFPDTRMSSAPVGWDGGNEGGDGSRMINQPPDCAGGVWFSNSNSNNNPYIVFDDFVADGSQLTSVEFYGGMWDLNAWTGCGLSNLSSVGIEIWTVQGGGACGWQYANFVAAQTFSVASLNPAFHCKGGFGEDIYKFVANFSSGISLNNGQNYMITIYGTLSDANHPCVFGWSTSTVNNFNPAVSWNRTTPSYDRCGPDNAFTLNPSGGGGTYCQKNDCNTTCWFSNAWHNVNPYIAADDWKPSASGPWTQVTFEGGGYNVNTGSPCGITGIDSFLIELYTGGPSGSVCGWNVQSFLGSFTVPFAATNPTPTCVDIFGIQHYKFTVNVPAGFNVTAGTTYVLGIYALASNPNDPCIFCWGGSSGVVGFPSYSYNMTTAMQEICHDTDLNYCVTVGNPCPVDCNGDTVVNSLDFLCFLNLYVVSDPKADFNGDTVVNSLDFLAFLNAYVAGCP